MNNSTLTTSLSTSDFATMATIPVTVFNPLPGGGASNNIGFVVYRAITISAKDIVYTESPVGSMRQFLRTRQASKTRSRHSSLLRVLWEPPRSSVQSLENSRYPRILVRSTLLLTVQHKFDGLIP